MAKPSFSICGNLHSLSDDTRDAYAIGLSEWSG